jgi:RsiW-degrading membrane proteinase PrsW (M82 family)
LIYEYQYEHVEDIPFIIFVLLAIVIAPFAEEFIKPLGIVFRARRETDEVEDGMIYGAACGLGFAATENLIYGAGALVTDGIATASLLLAVRTISSTLLHASATAITGYGIGLWLVRKKPFSTVIPYFLFAVLLHSVFNAIAMTNTLFGLVFVIAIALLATDFVKRKIIELDQRRAHDELKRRRRHIEPDWY